MKKLIILSGISGAGRSTAATILEEEKFQIIDNLPSELVNELVNLIILDTTSRYDRTAITVNILDLESLLNKLLLHKDKIDVKLILLTANQDDILSRYKLTRHVHPLQAYGYSLEEALQRERKAESRLRDRAYYFFDTSAVSVSMLRKFIFEIISESDAKLHLTTVGFTSFGFKHGLPLDADVVFDVRMIPNPYYIDELRPLTGLDEPVIKFLNEQEIAKETLQQINSYLEFYLESYIAEARGLISIAIGCSGGQHRSVYIAEELTKHFKTKGYRTAVFHRDKLKSRGF